LGGRFSVSSFSDLSLIRLHTNGALDQTFQSSSGRLLIRNLVLQADGKIITADSTNRTIFRFNADGTFDSSLRRPSFLIDRKFVTAATPITVAVQSDGRILVAGIFTDVDDADGPANGSRYGVARFNSDGTLDLSLTTPQRTGQFDYPDSLARLLDRTTLVGFSRAGFAGETAVPHGFARLRPDGSLDTSFDPIAETDPNGSLTPSLIAQGFRVLADGKIFVWGTKGFLGDFTYGRLAADGSEDKNFITDPQIVSRFAGSSLDVVLPQQNGKIFVGSSGAQSVVNGAIVRRVAPDGSVDTSFELDPAITSQLVERDPGGRVIMRIDASSRLLAVQPDGKVLFINNNFLRRLNPDGTIDDSFRGMRIQAPLSTTFPTIFDPFGSRSYQPSQGVLGGDSVVDTAVQPDGRIIITGPWVTPEGAAAPGIARLNADGSDDPSFQVGSGPQWTETSAANQRPLIEQIELQTDGRLLVVGTFEAFNGVPAPGIVTLNPDGSVDTSFVAPAVRQKSVAGRAKLARQSDGSFLLSGPYSYPGETSAPSLLRIVAPAVANISTRISIGTGENVLIGGFIVTGNAPKKVIIRGIGPSLQSGGQITRGTLQDPIMELRTQTGALLVANDDWRSTQEQEIIDTEVAPTDNRESAIVATLEPGAYTAIVKGKNNGTGIGVVEVYDLGTASFDPASISILANISTRGFVQTGDNVMIGGFIVTGAPARVIVRTIGPSLTKAGVAGALQDTTLEFVDGNGMAVTSNDDWRTGGQEQEIIATTVPPTDDRESAVVASLAPGAYTAVVRGKDSTTGVALVEVYVLD
ncbi:MAG TPA: hypothetical protein VK993_08575, partial [Chthoniobacterales bacterium]|nr:hypothetical protein [Chthoniobacterales bacterium]